MPADPKAFWNARAREDAFFFVDNRLNYGDPDEARFWTDGERDFDVLLATVDARLEAADRVVEIGCGVGRLTRVAAERAGDVRALDVSGEMLELARRYNPQLANVEWIEGDGVSLAGIADATADACFSHVVFQHIPDARVTLGYVAEVGRVLRSGGWAALQVSNDPAVHRAPSRRQRLGGLLERGPRGTAHPAWRGSHVELDELTAVADRAGMDVERIVGEGTQFCVVRLRRRERLD